MDSHLSTTEKIYRNSYFNKIVLKTTKKLKMLQL